MLQDVLHLPPDQLQAGWDATRQLNEGPVEERRPNFETARHGGPVDRHQVLAGEIELAVLIDQPVHRGQPRRLADGRHHVLVGLKLSTDPAHTFREERRPLQRRETPQPELGTDLGRKWEASEELLQQQLDTAVPCRGRQAAHAQSRPVLNPRRQTLQPSRPAIRQERRVSTEELVTPVPAQHHGHAPSSRLREPIQQEKRAVDERLIEQIAHALQKQFSVLHRELDFRMVGGAMPGDRPSERPLIVAGLGKA